MMSSKSKDSLEFQELPENMEVGQVWGITWNASEEELVVIKKILDGSILACPVTYRDNFYPAIKIEPNSNYYVWPNIEFQYDYSLMDTYYGKFFDGKNSTHWHRVKMKKF